MRARNRAEEGVRASAGLPIWKRPGHPWRPGRSVPRLGPSWAGSAVRNSAGAPHDDYEGQDGHGGVRPLLVSGRLRGSCQGQSETSPRRAGVAGSCLRTSAGAHRGWPRLTGQTAAPAGAQCGGSWRAARCSAASAAATSPSPAVSHRHRTLRSQRLGRDHPNHRRPLAGEHDDTDTVGDWFDPEAPTVMERSRYRPTLLYRLPGLSSDPSLDLACSDECAERTTGFGLRHMGCVLAGIAVAR